MSDVVVYSEREDLALELVAPGRALADASGGRLVMVAIAPGRAPPPFEYGIDHAIWVRGASEAAFAASTLAKVVASLSPTVVLIGGTREGTEAAARLGQKLRVPCVTRAKALALDGGALVAERDVLGRFVATQRISARPELATVMPGRFDPPARTAGRIGTTSQLELSVSPRVERLSVRARLGSGVLLEKASVVVAAGRGLRRREDLEIVTRLARALGGEVGASRPVTDDLQWLPSDAKVGLSGHTIRPELYVALGISGQLEHIVGMRESRVVVAINTDPGAPIFAESDYNVVGDLYAVIPALLRALEED